jgi:hypothetical protein
LNPDEVMHDARITTTVIVRLDRTTQYAAAHEIHRNALQYWATRLRGW